MTVEENKQVARQAFEALAAADLSPVKDLLTPDAVVHQCGFLHPIPAQTIIQGGFPVGRRVRDREVQLERLIAEGDIAALHWRTSGRYIDEESPQRDGTPISFPSMTFLRIESGRIAEIWNIQDISTLQTQLQEPTEPVPAG